MSEVGGLMSKKRNSLLKKFKWTTLLLMSFFLLLCSMNQAVSIIAEEGDFEDIHEVKEDALMDPEYIEPVTDEERIITLDPVTVEETDEFDTDESSLNSNNELGRFSISSFSLDTIAEPTAAITAGFLNLDGATNQTILVYPTATSTSKITYINASSVQSGIVPFYATSNGRYKIMVAGLEGWISTSGTTEYSSSAIRNISHYTVVDRVVNGKTVQTLMNYVSRGAMLTSSNYFYMSNGPAPSYLSKGQDYYSFDGHYFYTNANTMLSDYQNGHRNNSLNKNTPFYNYFQFLSYRSKSNISQATLDRYFTVEKGYNAQPTSLASLTSKQSRLLDSPKDFISIGNTYGTNPITSIGIAINESGWGRSKFAIERYNLFGHSAYDSYPGAANSYGSTANSIHSHSVRFLNWGYFDTADWRYMGAYLGNKASGVNVQYASDPFWGEKAAEHYYTLDNYAGGVDYGKEKIGVVKTAGSLNVRKEASSTSSVLYSLSALNQSVIILGETTAETINGSNVWYKIASDPLLDSNRNRIVYSKDEAIIGTTYNYDKNYGYVHSSFIQVVNEGKDTPVVTYKRGDVNGDGKVSALDYVAIKNHILNIKKLTGEELSRADVNKDGKVSALDYVAVKNHILGISSLD